MKSNVAEEARRARIERDLAMTAAERVALAFDLGERDLVVFMTANGVSREEALRILDANKRKGRGRAECLPRPR